MKAYYNEIEPRCCQWIQELMNEGVITKGKIDNRPIQEVRPIDLVGYNRVHFFAGIAGWEQALKLANWGDQEIWTGSCPCQSFSCAGKRKGIADERHLWPQFFQLIQACRPEVVIGEQVASAEVLGTQLEADFALAIQAGECARANKLAKQLVRNSTFHFTPRWLDGVFNDLEGAFYACKAADIPSASVNSPNIRQRLFWVAHSRRQRDERRGKFGVVPAEAGSTQEGVQEWEWGGDADCDCEPTCGLAHPQHAERRSVGERGQDGRDGSDRGWQEAHGESGTCEQVRGVGNASPNGCEVREQLHGRDDGHRPEQGCDIGGMGDSRQSRLAGRESQPGNDEAQRPTIERNGSTIGFWSSAIWWPCRDSKARRVPASQSLLQRLASRFPPSLDGLLPEDAFPLCEKIQGRAALLKGFGNAINVQVAAEFIRAVMAITTPSSSTGAPPRT